MKYSEIRSIIQQYTVGIAGAGGLGSNCAVALARTGIGTLVISDFDIVHESNLNRQYFFMDQIGMMKTEALRTNIEKICEDTRVITFETELTGKNIPDIYKDCDIIVEAFDRSEMKLMLYESVLKTWPDKPLIMGSGLAGFGETNSIREDRISESLIICGDQKTEVSEDLPPLAPRVGIVANMQANVVIELIIKMNQDENNA